MIFTDWIGILQAAVFGGEAMWQDISVKKTDILDCPSGLDNMAVLMGVGFTLI